MSGCGSDGGDAETPATTAAEATPTPAPATTDAPVTEPLVTESTTTAPPSTEAPAPDTVDLTVGVPFGVVQIAALGSLADDPEVAAVATVTEQTITAPDQLRTGFVAGDLDVAILPTDIAATLFNRGVDVRLIGVVDARLLHVLGPPGSGWADLAGVVDIAFRGDAADLVFQQMAAANGVDVSGLDVRYGTALPDLVGAAAGGNVTTAVLPEHFATAATLQAGANGHDLVPIIDLQDEWSGATGGDRLPQVAVVAIGSLVDERPDVVDALRAAITSALDDVVADPATASVALAEATGLPEPLISGLLPRLELAVRDTAAARADLDLFFEGLFASGPDSIGGALPAEAFFAS